MVEHKTTNLKEYSYQQPEASPSIEKGKAFVDKWEDSLYQVVSILERKGTIHPDAVVKLNESITQWASEDPNKPDHGGFHSYYVYEGMQTLANADKLPVKDEIMQAEAVLHDIVQTLPMINLSTGEEIKGINAREIHAYQVGLLTRAFGKSLGLKEEEVREISHAVKHHDDVYTGREYTPKYDSGALLSDADKLFGAGLEFNPQTIAEEAMKRNLTGAKKAEGWYLLRSDMDSKDRDEWQYGRRWVSDAVSAVRKEFFTMELFTNSGKKLAQQKREAFSQAMESVYGQYYQEQQNIVEGFVRGEKDFSVCGKGTLKPDVDLSKPAKALLQLEETELDIESKYRVNEISPKGWKLVSESGDVIDPSVARFMFDEDGNFDPESGKEEFFEELEKAFTS